MVYNFFRPEAEYVSPKIRPAFWYMNNRLVWNPIRVVAPDSSLKTTSIRTSHRGRSWFRDSACITKGYLCRRRRPSMGRDATNFKQNPKTHSISLRRGKPTPTTKAQDHVRAGKRRGIQNARQIRLIAEHDQEIFRPVSMQREISPRNGIVFLDEAADLVRSQGGTSAHDQHR